MAQVLVVFTILVLSFVVALPLTFGITLDDCYHPSHSIVFDIQCVIALLLLLVCIYLLWGVQDAFLIKFELMVLFFLGSPCFLLYFLSVTLRWDGYIYSGTWINLAQLVTIITTVYIPVVASFTYARSLKRKRKESSKREGESTELGTYHGADLQLCLNNAVLLEQFQEFFLPSFFSLLPSFLSKCPRT